MKVKYYKKDLLYIKKLIKKETKDWKYDKQSPLSDTKLLLNKLNKDYPGCILNVRELRYWIDNIDKLNIDSMLCKECGAKTNYINKKYSSFCCVSCTANSKDILEKIMKTKGKPLLVYKNKLTPHYIEYCTKLHKGKYKYKKDVFDKQYIKAYCKECKKEITLSLYSHYEGSGCELCAIRERGINKRLSYKSFLERSKKVHGNKYNYDKSSYGGSDSKIRIYCKTCKSWFEQSARSHFNGCGCPKCNNLQQGNKYSNKEIRCINELSKRSNLMFKTLDSGQEYQIKGPLKKGTYKLDGYNKRYNIAIEFNGDIWHGNPKLYKSDYKSPITKKTAGELYAKTKEKEKYLRKLGYKVFSIWEYDWDNNKDKVIKKFDNFITKLRYSNMT